MATPTAPPGGVCDAAIVPGILGVGKPALIEQVPVMPPADEAEDTQQEVHHQQTPRIRSSTQQPLTWGPGERR